MMGVLQYPSLLAPLPIPEGYWQVISLNFIEGLSKSGSTNCVLVIMDKFSKYAHFLPLLHQFTASTMAQIFLDNIYNLHGMPTAIISDRDRIFTSSFWQELFKLAKVSLQMSSSYHL
jgi:hypothetical protein